MEDGRYQSIEIDLEDDEVWSWTYNEGAYTIEYDEKKEFVTLMAGVHEIFTITPSSVEVAIQDLDNGVLHGTEFVREIDTDYVTKQLAEGREEDDDYL